MIARLLGTGWFLLGILGMPVLADEPTDKITVYSGFETFGVEFLPEVIPKNKIDQKLGFCVLTNIEAFFLLDRKGRTPTANWPPKRHVVSDGEEIRVTCQTDPPSDCYVKVRPSFAENGKTVDLSIEAPEGSAFKIDGEFTVRLAPTDVVYIPSQTPHDNGKRRLYLMLQPVINDND